MWYLRLTVHDSRLDRWHRLLHHRLHRGTFFSAQSSREPSPTMSKLFVAAICAALIAAPAWAQTDPSIYGTAMVQTGQAVTMAHANGAAHRSRANGTPVGRSSRAAQTCANLPRAHARLGAGNPSVQGLERACRRGGYL